VIKKYLSEAKNALLKMGKVLRSITRRQFKCTF